MVDNLRTKIELGQQLLEKKKGGCYLSRALVHKVPSPRRDVNLRGFDIFFLMEHINTHTSPLQYSKERSSSHFVVLMIITIVIIVIILLLFIFTLFKFNVRNPKSKFVLGSSL